MNKSFAWAYFPNMISKAKCGDILKLAQKKWEISTLFGGGNSGIKDSKIRKSDIVFVREEWLFKEILDILNHTNQFGCWNFDIDGVEDVQLTRYNKGDYYDFHMDGNGVTETEDGKVRKMSMSIILNDDYEGGEFEFFGDKDKPKNGIGTVIVFPSYFVHRVNPVTKGIRYSLVAWFGGPKFH